MFLLPSACADKLQAPEDLALDQPAENQNGVGLILQTLENSQSKAVIIFVGSARDVAAAYNRRPDLFRKKVPRHLRVHRRCRRSRRTRNSMWVLTRRHSSGSCAPMCHSIGFHASTADRALTMATRLIGRSTRVKVLEKTATPLQRYFLYMLHKETNEPIAYLSQPLNPTDRNWLMAGRRNLWCGALLGLAGRTLVAG